MTGSPADRISNLPCDVINQIQEHLPLGDVVRTSILSRGWRHKWVTIQHLSFDRDFEEWLNGKYDLESIIDRILLLHEGDVVKFSLVDCGIEKLPAINRWLFFSSDHRIKDLVISFSSSGTYPIIPVHLFAFDHLTHLNIKSCEVKLPPTFGGFRRLVSLGLVDVDMESGDLDMWLSKCPMLEYLYMDSCCRYLCLDIDVPNLKFFHFLGWIKSISIKNSNLEEISISCEERGLSEIEEEHFELPDSRGSESTLFRVLGHALSLKKLYLDCWTVPYLAVGGLPRKLLNDLNHLTLLEFSSFVLGAMIDVACAFCLIRSSPNLQSFKLTACDGHEFFSEAAVVKYLKEEQQKCDVPLSCLKYVKIRGISNMEHEMELVKLLLQLATALETLEIESKFGKSTDNRDGYKMLKEIASFRRASSRAAVIFD